MKFDISELKITPRTYAYVVIWKKNLASIPPLSTEFFKKLFQNNELQYNFTQNGLQVQIPLKPINVSNTVVNSTTIAITIKPQPQIFIGYQNFIHLHTNYDDFIRIYDGLVNELKSKYNSFYSILEPSQIGINIDYDVIYPDSFLNEDFFKERFVGSSFVDFGFKNVVLQEINLQLIEEGKHKVTQLKIQPLVSEAHGIYFHSNDHFGITPSEKIFTSEQLKKYCDNSIEKMKTRIIPFINNT